MNRSSKITIFTLVGITALIAALFWGQSHSQHVSAPSPSTPNVSPAPSKEQVRKKVVINEAIRTLLYVPLYHAVEMGYFSESGIDVDIVTGGTATNSFAALISGEAQFSQADPMYVPISREKGGKTKVVAQVVGRIAVWGLTKDEMVTDWSAASVKGRKISTQVRPMTAFVYTNLAVTQLGLDPEKDVEILQSKPPGEIAPLLNGEARFAFTLEPNTSLAVSQGARVVLSFPNQLGDQVFTGLMTTEDYIQKDGATVRAVVKAYQRALADLQKRPEAGLASAKKYFPTLDDAVIRSALKRMVDERVIPTSVEIPEESWNKAIQARLDSGDLKQTVSREDGCELSVMRSR